MNTAWTWTLDEDHTGWLRFDLPDEKVNKLTSNAMAQFDRALEDLGAQIDLAALVILSGKPNGFIAGADVAELAAIADPPDATEKSRIGQRLFNKLAQIGVPTVAVIHGPCMGGGTELSLACDYRLATDDPKTSIGLPEVNLGIIPGWGGTQRLPAVIGLTQALTMIMSGRAVAARKALKLGLVDGLIAHAFLQEQTRRFLVQARSTHGHKRLLARRRKRQPVLMRILEKTAPGRALICRQAAKKARQRTGGHYPAPLEALEAVRRGLGQPLDRGLSIEAQAFGRLAPTPTSKNLVWIFQAQQRLKKTHTVGNGNAPCPPIRRGAVVGAGVMGGGIAWALSHSGLPVTLKDVSWEAVAKGMAAAAQMFQAMVERQKMTRGQMNLAMHRITPISGFEGFGPGTDVVIEAVVEDMQIKQNVLQEIEEHVAPTAMICTNTSSLPVTQMGQSLKHPDRLVGLHFFNPVNRMPLVEVVPGEQTSSNTVLAAVALARRLGKTPIVVRDRPGFLVNRILLPYVVESVRIFEDGIDVKRIDHLIEGFGMPMGPLALADEVGLDVGLKVAQVLEEAFGSRMSVPGLLEAAVRRGDLLGKKTAQGFYLYDNGRKRPNTAVAKLTQSPTASRPQRADLSDEQIVDRAILTMVNEAARCLEEGIVECAETLDMAMLLGAGFAPFRGGLLRWADTRGANWVAQRLKELSSSFGDRFKPAPLIERLATDGGRFHRDQTA